MKNKNKIEEIWRDIVGYEGLYQVSNFGNVKSLSRVVYKSDGRTLPVKERVLKPVKDGNGYIMIGLCKDGKHKRYTIHRLVAQAFLPNPNNLPQVNHKDEDKINNNVDNLEWCDAKYNSNYGTRTERAGKASGKTRSKQVAQIDKTTGEIIRIWPSTNECGRNGFNQGHIASCCRGELNYHKGYIWKYI